MIRLQQIDRMLRWYVGGAESMARHMREMVRVCQVAFSLEGSLWARLGEGRGVTPVIYLFVSFHGEGSLKFYQVYIYIYIYIYTYAVLRKAPAFGQRLGRHRA